jgi:predicted ester cyclase
MVEQNPHIMVTVDNKTLIKEYISAISGHKKTPELVNRFVSDTKLKNHIQFFENSFPKYEMIVEDMLFDKDKVALRARAKGVHKGSFMGLPPTGKNINLPFMVIYKITDGLISDNWISFDQMELMNQLGQNPMNN